MKRIFNIVFPIIMVVAAVVVIVFGVKKMASKKLYDASTTAVITGIEREWTGTDEDGFDQYEYHVYINYEVDGKKYENKEYPGYSSSMKQGDELTILYKTSNPEEFAEENVTGNGIIMIVFGVVFIVLAVVVALKALLRP